ncbi:MAG: hypothetical protein L6R45_10025 [Anaerolineae bacterium]|nr:hypothetical protein [Anaerolineae bacterium]
METTMAKPVITDAWTLAVIGCETEGITLDACLIFVPPGTDMAEAVRIGGEAGIPHPYLRAALVLGPEFDPGDIQVDVMHPYVG